MRRAVFAAATLPLLLAPLAHAAPVVALDGGAPLWDGVLFEDKVDAVASTGVKMVRLNFRLDRWSSPADTTPQGPDDLTFFAAYDRLVDAYLARGIQVYGLLNDELVGADAPVESEAFVQAYAADAVAVIDHFKDRIRVWELFNEPNDWAGGSDPRLDAYWFALLLQETYLQVKHHAGHIDDPCWQVTLISGPLFSFDGTTAAEYLAEVYDIGRTQLAWDWTREHAGSFPLDGIGYHIYVRQDAGASLADVAGGITGNLDALWSVVESGEEGPTAKQIWVSEYGWRADLVGDAGQADRLEAGYTAMAASDHVAAAFYFQLQDFPDNQWGLFRDGGFDAGHRRPAADRLAALAAANPDVPPQVADGCGPPDEGDPPDPPDPGEPPPTADHDDLVVDADAVAPSGCSASAPTARAAALPVLLMIALSRRARRR